MFDTHCHLNFHAFEGIVEETIQEAIKAGMQGIVMPGTDIKSSTNSVLLSGNHENLYAAVGIHPHHIYQYQIDELQGNLEEDLKKIENLVEKKEVVAVGEIGLDRHYYEKTKYSDYQIDSEFIGLQKEVFLRQIELAKTYKKSLILHNREAKKDFLEVLTSAWVPSLEGKVVFHCCEPDEEFLAYAKEHKIFIGVDGDVTYSPTKREFAKKIPLSMLVLETDSPFLLPEPYRSYPKDKKPINTPTRIRDIGVYIAKLKDVSPEELFTKTTENAKNLFQL